jgi:hypothetical protein
MFDGLPHDPKLLDRTTPLHSPQDPPIFIFQVGPNVVRRDLAGQICGTVEITINFRLRGDN